MSTRYNNYIDDICYLFSRVVKIDVTQNFVKIFTDLKKNSRSFIKKRMYRHFWIFSLRAIRKTTMYLVFEESDDLSSLFLLYV